MRRFQMLAVAFATLSLVAAIVAQDQPQPARNPNQATTTRTTTVAAQPGIADADLAGCLLIDNHEEVAIAEWAQKKAQSDRVKEFSRQMIEDHTQFIQKLDKFHPGISRDFLTHSTTTTTTERRPASTTIERKANDNKNDKNDRKNDDTPKSDDNKDNDKAPKADNPPKADDNAAENRNPSETRTTTTTTRTARDAHGAHMGKGSLIELKKELAAQCFQSLTKELGEKDGAKFDQCYMTHQAMMHQKMVDTLTVFRRHASPSFASVLDEGLKTSQQHFSAAKDIVKSLDHDAPDTARKPESKTKTQ